MTTPAAARVRTQTAAPAATKKKSHISTRLLTITGLFAALIAIMTAYIGHIPTGVNGGYLHFGDSLAFLAASLLPTPYALAAAAIGGGLADLLTAPMWAPATIAIKMLIVLPFTGSSDRIITRRNLWACTLAILLSGAGYFLAESILFGSVPALLLSLLPSLVQGVGSAAIYVVFGIILDKSKFKKCVFP